MTDTEPASQALDITDMERLAAGEDAALDRIMFRWKSRIAAFLLRMTNNHATAADLAQETFVRLYFARHSFRPRARFSTYLFHIAANLARNHFRFLARHPAVSMDGMESLPDLPYAVSTMHPATAALSSEREKEILDAIAALPEDQRISISLSLFDNLGSSEIAKVLGCSTKAAANHLYRARQSLRRSLAHLASAHP